MPKKRPPAKVKAAPVEAPVKVPEPNEDMVAPSGPGLAQALAAILTGGAEQIEDPQMKAKLQAMYGEESFLRMIMTRLTVQATGGDIAAYKELRRDMYRTGDPDALMGFDAHPAATNALLAGFATITDGLQRRLIIAFSLSGSNVTEACSRAGTHRSQHYRFMEDDDRYGPAVAKAMAVGDARRVDRAELMLDRKVAEGDMRAIDLLLKAKGRDRGYVTTVVKETHNTHEFFNAEYDKGKYKDVTPEMLEAITPYARVEQPKQQRTGATRTVSVQKVGKPAGGDSGE